MTITLELTANQTAILDAALSDRIDSLDCGGEFEEAIETLDFLDDMIGKLPVTKARNRRRLELAKWRIEIGMRLAECEGEAVA